MSTLEDYGQIISSEEITQEMIDDLFCSALEGGITYWASDCYPENGVFPDGATYVSECLSRGAKMHVVDIEERDAFGYVSYILTLPKFIDGIQKAVNHYGCSLQSLYENHDADTADVIVQFAIFGDIIYG